MSYPIEINKQGFYPIVITPTGFYPIEISGVLTSSSDPLLNGLVGWWKMDEGSGTTTADSSGYGNTGTLTGSTLPTWTTGVSGNCLSFDGLSSLVNCGNSSSLQITGSVTLCGWVNGNSNGGSGAPFSKLGTVDVGRGMQIQIDGVAADVTAYIAPTETTLYSTTATAIHNTTKWMHYAMVFNPGVSLILYQNGINVSENDIAVPSVQFNSDNFFSIGGRPDGNGYWNGSIDNVRLYNRALPSSDIVTLFSGSL